jgi:tetratricopeptide (TPR) repeat protein
VCWIASLIPPLDPEMVKTTARSAAGMAAIVLLAVVSACAPKKVDLPDPSAAPRYPEFVYPEAPASLGSPAVQERHKAGWLWLQAGDLRAAERSFDATLQLMPEFYPAEAGLGWVGLARRNTDNAVSHFDRAVGVNPQYVPALVGRGEALLAKGDRDNALKSFEAAVAVDANLAALRSRIEVLRFRGLQDDVAEARRAAEANRLDDARTAYERAIVASPQSPFLFRELAAVERRAGNLTAALAQAQKAVDLEPTEPRNLLALGEIYEAQGELAKAVEAFDSAHALEPDPGIERRIDDLREKLLLAAMPPEFLQIESSPNVSRAELAALIGVRLDDLLKRAPRRTSAVITDTRGSWASPWILLVTRSGVMEVYPNHTFQPENSIRRADLAQAASRVLSLIAAERPRLAESWRSAGRKFPDVSPGHLAYPAAALSVEAGVMRPLEDGSFQLARPVTGAEAAAAVKKLEELAQSTAR